MEPFIGEVRLFPFNFTPQGWLPCDGRALSTTEYEPLFNLLGDHYGANGTQTFNVPNLEVRVPIGINSNHQVGQTGGSLTAQVTGDQLPTHNHGMMVSNGAGTFSSSPKGKYLSTTTFKDIGKIYAPSGMDNMEITSITFAFNEKKEHENRQPFITLPYFICYEGIFPTEGSQPNSDWYPLIGEIRPFPYDISIEGWVRCDGQSLSIAQNTPLYAVIGNTFGGDNTHFNVPDMTGRVVMGSSIINSRYEIGATGGVEEVTLTEENLPMHNHQVVAYYNNGTSDKITGNVTAVGPKKIYSNGSEDTFLADDALQMVGGNMPHSNMQPFLSTCFMISTTGATPVRSEEA